MNIATAKPVTYKSSLLGTVTLHTYVDPFPGKVGTDTAPGECSRCGGRGYFECYGFIYNGKCFKCHGAGQVPVKVSTLRKYAKLDAFTTEYADELAAYWAAFEAAQAEARAVEEFAAAWDAAHAEQARRAAMVSGFMGEVGDKLTNLPVTIKVAKYMAAQSYNRSSSMFIIAEDAEGHVLKFSGSSVTLFGLERGQEAVIATAKVKGHETYNGQDQTVLKFVKMVEAAE